jgi:hypothetical protein
MSKAGYPGAPIMVSNYIYLRPIAFGALLDLGNLV